MLIKTLIMLAILFVGIVLLSVLFAKDCRKVRREREEREGE